MRTTKLVLIGSLILTTGCSSLPKRARSTDPVMRVAIDAETLTDAGYARLVHAVMESGKFVVVDRNVGFRAVAREQEMQQTTTRFGANEKYALWSKLYGAGGIFVASQQCEQKYGFMGGSPYVACIQNLELVNATTGEVMASSETSETANGMLATNWEKSVDALIDRFPQRFVDESDLHKTVKYEKPLEDYRNKTIPENVKKSMDMDKHDVLR